MTPFGIAVTQVLQRNNISQRLLANKLNWNASYLSMILGGHYARLKSEFVIAIADALEVNPHERSLLLDAAKISHRQYKIPYHVPESSYKIAHRVMELIEMEDEKALMELSQLLFEPSVQI